MRPTAVNPESSAPGFLTADIGNSALKLVRWMRDEAGGARIESRLDLAHADWDRSAAWLERIGPLVGAAISCVAAPERRAELAAQLARRVNAPTVPPPTPQLAIECSVPSAVGDDRIFGALGALVLVGAPALVVDAGTALTVDALAAGARPGTGRFLGGAIAPGPALLARALASETARLPRVEASLDAPALGRDTEGAIRAGIVVGFAGAAGHLAREIAREAGFADPVVVLTGGAREFLRTAFVPRSPVVVPELVHVGLLVAGTGALGDLWKVRRES